MAESYKVDMPPFSMIASGVFWGRVCSGLVTLSYDANGNLTSDGFHTYGWDADGNLITVDGVTGTFDALERRVELGASPNYSQMIFSPADPRRPIGLAAALTATGIRLPLPGGGEVEYNSSGLWNYRHPNWPRDGIHSWS